MDDSQWCLDECPTCATVVHGQAIYCSPECEPEMEPQAEEDSVPWPQYNSNRVSTWALDCYKKSTLAPANAPCIFASPSQRKLHIRKRHPTSWVTTSEASVDSSTCISSSISTGPIVETLVAGSIGLPSPKSAWRVRSWASPPPGPPSQPLLTKTNVYLFSNSTTHPLLSHSNETSDRPGTPLEKWDTTAVVESECSRTPDRRRRDGRPTFRSRTGP
ncbi:hypothetical protein B0H16DRAFT_880492 [Mycena metata]|uniref:Uncharacterized protein n=1 Tax=Mycena metata TaxID=1033252 RepID=A0AAD7K4H1_9AGAR|nr:hypothetical protein B0H16DRAFT_880492 [Mycena metata]